MTLDEAIKHAEEVVKEKYNEAQESIMCNRFQYSDNCRDCAEEHEQLAKWLKELKQLRNQISWIPVSERLPEEKLFNPSGSDFGFEFEEVLCTTIWGDVRAYKFGKPIGHDKPHFWFGAGIMDEYVIAWQYKPEPYKKEAGEPVGNTDNAPTVERPQGNVAYLCDGDNCPAEKASCKHGGPCRHTTNIEHAINFRRIHDTDKFFEVENVMRIEEQENQ